jgi:peptidoglycan/LPS O-acetylase OafA/YrhL
LWFDRRNAGDFLPEQTAKVGFVTKDKTMAQPHPSSSKRGSYLPSLDGWRAIAILWVLEGHSAFWKCGPFSNGWLRATDSRGVQLFFALSGFLICTRLLREEARTGSISLKSFYTRRVFRIQPAALTYLVVVVLLSVCGMIPRFWSAIAGAALMVRNIWPVALRPGYWYTAHFWSLAVEEHFYLLLPGFLVLFRRSRLALLLGTVVALQIWQMIVLSTPRLQHGMIWQVAQRSDMAMGGILLGSAFAVALTHERLMRYAVSVLRPWVALLYTAFVFVEVQRHHSTVAQMSITTVYPLLIIATVLHPDTVTGRLLELAPARFLGRISYSVYLWQQLFSNGQETPSTHSLYSHVLLCWCATFCCAIASYYLIETPLIRIGHKIAKRFDVQEDRNLPLLAPDVAKAANS